jgi:hypothetical protein
VRRRETVEAADPAENLAFPIAWRDRSPGDGATGVVACFCEFGDAGELDTGVRAPCGNVVGDAIIRRFRPGA